MALQVSNAVRSAMADAIETAIGASPKLRLRTGSAPASLAAAATGTVVAEMTLPADWMAAAVNGVKSLSGSWQDGSADATGTVAHFEIVSSDGATRHLQGTVTGTGLGGDIELQNTSVNSGQAVSITAFNLTVPA
jgi:hypothetical protein